MAASVDSYSDLEDSEVDNLTESFNKATDHAKKLISGLDSTKLLEIYSYYKQATEGPCRIPRPRWFEMQAKAKWEAWNQLGELPIDNAKQQYIKIISELDSNFDPSSTKSESWVTVSSLLKPEDDLKEADKTVFDFTKEGDLKKLVEIHTKNSRLIHSKDENGLSLLHWASDRGNLEILKFLVQAKIDVNSKDNDGQTALHYAASCDHFSCVEFLINSGADIDSEDSDGLKPKDLATEVTILDLLK